MLTFISAYALRTISFKTALSVGWFWNIKVNFLGSVRKRLPADSEQRQKGQALEHLQTTDTTDSNGKIFVVIFFFQDSLISESGKEQSQNVCLDCFNFHG